MKNLGNDIKVGLFIILGFAVLLFMSFKMGSLTIGNGNGQNYIYIYFNSISGLNEKAKVRMQGVTIGEIFSITLEDRKVKITASLNGDFQIPRDSVATIQTSGLLGDRYINIQPGIKDEFLGNKETIEFSEDPVSIDQILAKLSGAIDDVRKFADGLNGFFEESSGEGGSISSIMSNVGEASELLKLMLAENRVALREGIGNIRDFSAKLDAVIGENKKNIKEGLENIKNVTGNLDGVIVENRENFKKTMENLRTGSDKLDEIMKSMQQVTGKIERGEGTIGRLVQDEEIYENINETLSGAQGMLGKIDNIKIGLGIRAERLSKQEKTKSYFSLRIKPREDKYYMFEITEDARRHDLKVRNTVNSLLYTMLVNKRFGDVGLEAGLMESSGGVGLDFYAFRDSLRFSADLFNLSGYDNNSPNPQLKVTGRYYIQKYVYLYMGGDELLNDYYKTFFGGLGVMVDEDDLKFFFSLL